MTTTHTPNQYTYPTLDQIVASLTNPRKTFDHAKLAELAESINAFAVHTPILVRPLPASRLEDTAHLKPRPIYELVSGERRYRASEIAGKSTIPAIISDLTDSEVLDIQLVENLQREDLSPLEEAEGYDQLMHQAQAVDKTPISVDDVATKIGKSRSYVYARLKLLDLGQEGREALRAGKLDASRALLIARIPDTQQQAEAVKAIVRESSYEGQPMSYRMASDHIQRQFMLKLSEAPFKITLADLLPAAGSCRECPKRTGANPDLFADVKGADVCTDPACYRAKESAHSAHQLAQAQANGQTIITGREAKELMPNSWVNHVEGGYLRLDDAADSPDKTKTLRALIGKQMEKDGIKPTLVANPHREGELIAVLPRETVSALLAAKGYQEHTAKLNADAAKSAKADAEAELLKQKTAFEEEWRLRVLAESWRLMAALPADYKPSHQFIRHIAQHYVGMLNGDKAKRLAKLLELGKVAPKEALATWVKETEQPVDALMVLVAHHEVEYQPWLEQNQTQVPQNVGLMLVAKDAGVDVDAVKEALKTKMAAERKAAKARETAQNSAEATKADQPLNPAAQAKGGRGAEAKAKAQGKKSKHPAAPAARGPKTSTEEAMQGIAAAMQSDGEESGADAGPSGSEPDGASAVGQGGRATPPDAQATSSQPTAEPNPGDLVEIIGGGPHKGLQGRVVRMNPDCQQADLRKVWDVDIADTDDDMYNIIECETARLKVIEPGLRPGNRVCIKAGSGTTMATVKKITDDGGIMVNFDGKDGDAIFRQNELERTAPADTGVAWPFPKKGAP